VQEHFLGHVLGIVAVVRKQEAGADRSPEKKEKPLKFSSIPADKLCVSTTTRTDRFVQYSCETSLVYPS